MIWRWMQWIVQTWELTTGRAWGMQGVLSVLVILLGILMADFVVIRFLVHAIEHHG